MGCRDWCQSLLRRKTLASDMFTTPLDRCLTTFDLTILGLAQMIGAGIFVLTGTVAKDIAGPAVILSFLFAGIAALLAALCYAEFGSLIPRTGSAYLFTYTVLGECLGFLVGWVIVAEQIIGSATVARSFSGSVDSIFNNIIQNKTIEAFGEITIPGFSPFPDFLSILPVVITASLAMSGAKLSAILNNILTITQLLVLLLIIILGYIYANFDNWRNEGFGGFFPYGVGGAFSGAATCFFAFVGFDSIAVAGEEAKNPRRSVPIALLLSLPIVCVIYILASSALTLIQPYYEIDVIAPFPVAFSSIGILWAKYVITFGSLVALFTTLLTSEYSMPRIIYAMASDGLYFKWMGTVNSRTKTPINAIIATGIPIIILSVLIEMEILVELYSIGTLMSFTFVSISLIKLHYEVPENNSLLSRYVTTSEGSHLLIDSPRSGNVGKLRIAALKLPLVARLSSVLSVNQTLLGMLCCQVLFGVCVAVAYHGGGEVDWAIFTLLIILGTLALLFFIFLCLHKTNDCSGGFRLPLSPLIETSSISINLLLMFLLRPLTWARISIWIALGMLVYLLYGRRHSKENQLAIDETQDTNTQDIHEQKVVPQDETESKAQSQSYGTL